MKKLILLLSIFTFYSSVNAQAVRPERNENKSTDLKKIQAMEMAFITKELNLSPDEAQKFWPIYNQYRNELKSIVSERSQGGDRLEKQQKVLDVRKKYRDDFTKVMTQDRANKVFGAEDEFKSLVRREFQKRQMERRDRDDHKKGF
jgi:hypothetical protein